MKNIFKKLFVFKKPEELSLIDLLVLIGNHTLESNYKISVELSTVVTNLRIMEEKIKSRSEEYIEGWIPASEVFGAGAKGYLSPDYKLKVQNYARSLGISVYKL